jgi:hypothetical protein
MGYRSTVMALIYPDADSAGEYSPRYEQLKLLMATTFKDVMKEFGGCVLWHDDDFVLKFTLEEVKWYPGYPDVQAFESMLSAFDEDIDGYCTEFVRIGEESDDIEERFNGESIQYYLAVQRSISCNI